MPDRLVIRRPARDQSGRRYLYWALLSLITPVLLAWALWRMVAIGDDERWITLHSALFIPQAGAVDAPALEPSAGLPLRARQVGLPHDWNRRDRSVHGWYLFDLELTVAPDRAWGVWLPRLAHDARVYVNGSALAGGLEVDVEHRNQNASVLRRVANGLLAPGMNRIAIQLRADRPGNGYLDPVRIGPYSVLLDAHEWADLIRVDSLRTITAMMLVVGSLLGLLWLWRRQEAVFGWFSLMMFMWVVHDIHPMLALPARADPLIEWLWHASLVWFIFVVAKFVYRFIGRSDPEFERRLAIWAILMPALTLPIAWLRADLFHDWAAPISDTATLLISCYPFLLIGRSLLRDPKPLHAGMVAAGFFPLVLGAHDWLVVTDIWAPSHGYLMPYGSVLVMLVFGGHLTLRFGRMMGAIEALNGELEQRVRAREQELAIKHAHLVRLETEKTLLAERARLMSDMHDGLGGTLISTLAMVQAGQTNPELLAESLREAIGDLRLMIDSLDPVDGDLGNVLANMRTRLEPKLRAAGMSIEWAVQDVATPAWLGSTGVLQVMRIVQEAINNVLKHAQASRLRIVLHEGLAPHGNQPIRRLAAAAMHAQRLTVGADAGISDPVAQDALEVDEGADERSVWVAVIDDGVGLPHGTRGGGRGLGNMRRRAQGIGAELQIMPAEPGTCVMLRIRSQAPA